MHYQAQLVIPDKGRAIKWLVSCVVWLGSMKYGMGHMTSFWCVCLVTICGQNGYRALVLQHPIYTYRNIYHINRLKD